MRMDAELSARFEGALPGKFEFYHLGEVVPARDPSALDLSSRSAVAFGIQGDARSLAIVLFDRALDLSTYTELGNVIVSRLASHLDVMISPPREITSSRARELMATAPVIARKTYLHESDAPTAEVEVVILSFDPFDEPREEAAHA